MKEDDQVKIILELKDVGLSKGDVARSVRVEPEVIEDVLHGREALGLFEEGRLLSLLHITRRLKGIMAKENLLLWLKEENAHLFNHTPLDILGPDVENLLSRLEWEAA